MEKLYAHKKNGGYLTLFSCLLFVAMAGLLLVCLDGILLYQGKSKGSMIQAGALEHLMANYDKALYERYHLFFTDPRLEPALEKRAKIYFEDILTSQTSSDGVENLLNMKVSQIQVQSFGTMQEDGCCYFSAQIRDFMKYDTAKDLLMQVLRGAASETKEQSMQVEETIEMLDQKEAVVQETPEHYEEDAPKDSVTSTQEQTAKIAQKSDLIDSVKKIMKGGILAYVAGDSEISTIKISPSDLPSGIAKEKKITFSSDIFTVGNMKALLEKQNFAQIAEDFSDKAVMAVYTEKYFNYYGKNKRIDNTELCYEMEYVIGGQYSDKENLEYVVNRMILFRFGMNAVYVLQDQRLNEQALVLAGILAGASGSPAVIEGVKYTILSVMALLESIEDVKILLAGDEIPLLKDQTTFRLMLSGETKDISLDSKKEGLTYEQYLMLLFLMQGKQERQMLRMQDIMQLNVAREEPGFLIKNCRVGVTMKTTLMQKTLFIPGAYEIHFEEKYNY